MTIASGFKSFPGASNASTSVVLMEEHWYHIPDDVEDIEASDFSKKKASFMGRRVKKREFMQVLGGLSRLMLRAKYHTDQLEGT